MGDFSLTDAELTLDQSENWQKERNENGRRFLSLFRMRNENGRNPGRWHFGPPGSFV